jgi:hypothetical protein
VASPREGEALMTWFKVDDKLHDHRKVRAAGKAAMGVWVLAGSWAADNLTDGFIPTTVLPRWGTRADANKLVTAGLWHTDEQDGEKGGGSTSGTRLAASRLEPRSSPSGPHGQRPAASADRHPGEADAEQSQ